jgi:hypothetical protein
MGISPCKAAWIGTLCAGEHRENCGCPGSPSFRHRDGCKCSEPYIYIPGDPEKPRDFPVLVPERVRDRLAGIAATMGRRRGAAATLGDAVEYLLEACEP